MQEARDLRELAQGYSKGGMGPPRRTASFYKITSVHQWDDEACVEQDYFFRRIFGELEESESEKESENEDVVMEPEPNKDVEMITVRGYYKVPRRAPSTRI